MLCTTLPNNRPSLITFNNSATAPPRVRRQAASPLVYNVTQNFAASAGVSYTLTAYASKAQNGNVPPDCSITICGDDTCGAPITITAQYSPYSYQFNAPSTQSDAVATFSVQCAQSAYVALDDVSVNGPGVGANGPSPATRTVTQYVTRTLAQQQNETLTETQTQQVANAGTKVYTLTNTVSMVSWATETAVVAVAQTKYLNLTVSDVSTTTSKSDLRKPLPARTNIPHMLTQTATVTRTLNLTTTVDRPSLVYETATATTIAIVTTTDVSLALSSVPPGTLTTIEGTTLEITTTVPPVTLPASTVITTLDAITQTFTPPDQTLTQTPFPSTELLTSTIYTTVFETSTLSQATESLQITLPQVTFTPAPETTYITVTLEPSTITSYTSVTPPPVTDYQTQTLTPATETLQITQTLPADTLIVTATEVDTEVQTLQLTQTLPADTSFLTATETGPTITETFTLVCKRMSIFDMWNKSTLLESPRNKNHFRFHYYGLQLPEVDPK